MRNAMTGWVTLLIAFSLFLLVYSSCRSNGVEPAADAREYRLEQRTHSFPRGSKKYEGTVAVFPDGREVEHGPWTTWYQSGGKCQQGEMWFGKDHGMRRGWWSSGVPLFESLYEKGSQVGRFREWDEGGNLIHESIPTIDAVWLVTSWWPNGLKRECGAYRKVSVEGSDELTPIGRHQWWDSEGQVTKVGEYNNAGNKIGIWWEYAENGAVVSQKEYNNKGELIREEKRSHEEE